MGFALGFPTSEEGKPLLRRVLWLNAVRLLVLLLLLGLTAYTFLGGRFELGTESGRLALAALSVSFAATGISTALLHRGWNVTRVTYVQLVVDQAVWTVLIHLSGGVSSAATPFYGLTCLAGAIVTGLRGAFVAALTGLAFFAGMGVSLHQHWLGGPADQLHQAIKQPAGDLIYNLSTTALGIVVVALLGGYLAERLRLTGGELVAAEQRADRAERMAALGRLATGLAHEIRNPLGSIAGSIRLLASNPNLNPEDRQLCQIIQREAARLNDLVTDMMDLAKPRRPNPMPVDVSALVGEVVTLASSSGRASSDVTICYDQPTEPLNILADSAQLRQLVWNLVKNAVQVSSAEDVVWVILEVVRDGQVQLRVIDQGPGIEQAMIPRLFDAFFTTRSHGTGVGLALVKRVADEHGFVVSVDNEQNRGACFTVRLGRPIDLNGGG